MKRIDKMKIDRAKIKADLEGFTWINTGCKAGRCYCAGRGTGQWCRRCEMTATGKGSYHSEVIRK